MSTNKFPAICEKCKGKIPAESWNEKHTVHTALGGDMNDYDEFKIWYTQKAPDESEVTMVDMAAMAWQAATPAQEARVRELEEALRGLMQACEKSFDWQYDPQFSATFSDAQQALSATAREST